MTSRWVATGDPPDPALLAWFAGLPAAWTRGCDPGIAIAARELHDGPGRHYHGWAHVLACLALLPEASVIDPRPAFLTLLFHDAVYVPGAKDNEARSADLARVMLAAACDLSADALASIERTIIATRDHHRLGASLAPDERAVLDLDLAVLGGPWEAYARYADGVEREYVPAVVGARAFRVGRAEFVEGLLARERIYLTDWGEARWGAAARANLARELAALRARQGPGERLAALVRRVAR